jgi:hypothetical protein
MSEALKIRQTQRDVKQGLFPWEKIDTKQLPRDLFEHIDDMDRRSVKRAGVIDFHDEWKMYTFEKGDLGWRKLPSGIYFCDYSDVKKYAGFTEVGLTFNQYAQVPVEAYVMNTETRENEAEQIDFQRLGLGTRRLITANRYCIQRAGVPLHSGKIMYPWARSLWQRLIETGEAENTNQTYMGEYRFKV